MTDETLQGGPVKVEVTGLQPEVGATRVFGKVRGGPGAPGTPIRLRFVLFGQRGQTLGSKTISVPTPKPGEATPLDFEVTTSMLATDLSWEVVP
ncbi:MAG TPA: hypothetical protein VFX98_17315 [Longimicrobiaceae bacterium]|nr:hypothetical protein [Longimicrobiaceae bacterium]